jgi:hypothetical protein
MSLFGVRFGAAGKQHDQLCAALREVHTPASAHMDSHLRHATSYRFHVSHQSTLQPLDPGDHQTANRGISDAVEPGSVRISDHRGRRFRLIVDGISG